MRRMTMENISIQAIKEMFVHNNIDEAKLSQLRLDKRKGVQKLILQYEKQREKALAKEQLYVEKMQFDHQYRLHENDLIAGVDEAGRGPLAGPVVAAARSEERRVGKECGAEECRTAGRSRRVSGM